MQCFIRAALVYEYSTATGLLSKQAGEKVKGPTSITQGNDLSISHQGHLARTNTFFPAPSPQPPPDLQSIFHMTQSCLCPAPSSLWLPSSPRTKSQPLRLAFEALPACAATSFTSLRHTLDRSFNSSNMPCLSFLRAFAQAVPPAWNALPLISPMLTH